MKKKRSKQLTALLLTAAMCFSALAGWQGKAPETKAAIYEGADLVLYDPIIEEDADARSGQKVTYDCLYFGNYPQAEVVSTTMLSIIKSQYLKEGDLIADDEAYHVLSSAADSAWDVNNNITIDNVRYRRVKSNPNHLYGVGGEQNAYHYFRYQPIKWRILKIESGRAFVLADTALDCKQYNTSAEGVTWETSTVRSWLNGYGRKKNVAGINYNKDNFIGQAFTEEEQNAVASAVVINDDQTYVDEEGSNDGMGGNDTIDKIFLLSQADVCDIGAYMHTGKHTQEYQPSYGFAESERIHDEARRCESSIYAKAAGIKWKLDAGYVGKNLWWLRTPGRYALNASYVDPSGYMQSYGTSVSYMTYAGIRPALWLDLSNHNLYDYAGRAETDGNSSPALKNIKLSPKTTQVVKGKNKQIKLKHVRAWNKAKGKLKRVKWRVRKQDEDKVKIKKIRGKHNRIAVIQVKDIGNYEVIAEFNDKKYICFVSGVNIVTKEDTEDKDSYGNEEPVGEEEDIGFNLEKNGYSFANRQTSFGYDKHNYVKPSTQIGSYEIPLERYQEVFGKSITKDLYIHQEYRLRTSSGNCFGMALSSVLFYEDKLELENYPDIETKGINKVCYDYMDSQDLVYLYTDSELTAMIERYHIAQSCARLRRKSMYQNTSKLANQASITDAGIAKTLFQNVISGITTEHKPYILCVAWGDKDRNLPPGGHAMVVDSSRAVEDISAYRGEGWYRIYLYDPNKPYSDKIYNKANQKNIEGDNACAKDRCIDVNVDTGKWQVGVNSIISGYDDAGEYINGSSIAFYDVDDFLGPRDGENTDDILNDSIYAEGSGYSPYLQTSFEEDDPKLWYFHNENGTSAVQYACDDFTVTDAEGTDVFIMRNGSIVYQDEAKAESIIDVDYTEGYEPDIADGQLILQGTGYTVHTESGGRIAFMENNVYKGVKAEGNLYITDSSTNGITVLAEKGTTANLLIETADDVDCTYTSVCMDVDIDKSDNVFSLKDNRFHGKVGKKQNLTVSVCTDDLGDYEVAGVTSAQLENWDVKAACPDKKESLITVPDSTGELEAAPVETKYIELPQEISISEKPDTLTEDDQKEAYPVGTEFTDKESAAVYIVTKRTDSGGTVTYVKPAKKNTASVVIPDKVTVDGLTFKVTGIKDGAFQNHKKLKNVVIGKNITTIGKRAFSGCKNLKKISIKTKKLTAALVGRKAFKGIHRNAVIQVPKSSRKVYKKILQNRGAGKKIQIRR